MLIAVAGAAANAAPGPRQAVPVFTIGERGAPMVAEIFFSPTCPDCFLAFRNAVANAIDGPVRRGKLLIVGYIMPRQQQDLRVGQILTCVPQNRLAALVMRYMLDRSLGVTYDDAAFLALIRRFGSGAASVDECMSERRETMLARNNAVGIALGVDDTPTWFIAKEKHQGIYFFWQLEPLLAR